MNIVKIKDVKNELVVEVLQKGGLVIMPTETLYGAFVDATNPQAVEKLTKYKARPFGKPYSVAVLDQKMAEEYVKLNEIAKNLYKNFLPGPLTVVSQGKHRVAIGVESETGTLGIRIPDYTFVLDIVKKFGKPITATSANANCKKRPYKISDILDNLSERKKSLIDLIVDAGELPRNEPSTVIDTTLDDVAILRQGVVKLNSENFILSMSSENTQNFAKELWQKYEIHTGSRAIVFALDGPMGAGKTVFTKGLAKAMGIKEEITSPTYDLEHSYNTLPNTYYLIHIDAWRMENSKELQGINFAKKITDKSIIAIEWADRVSDEIRKYSEDAIIVWVKINYGKKENERNLTWDIV